jgi:hypothetical protein
MQFSQTAHKGAEKRPTKRSESCKCRESVRNRIVAHSITFTEEDLKLKKYPHEDPLVIRVVLRKNTKYLFNNNVGGILVDNGTSAYIITY